MPIVLLSIVLGVLVGIILGGSLRTLADARLRWWPLALGGLALQLIPAVAGESRRALGLSLLLLSYGLLLAFAVVNIRNPGFILVTVGVAMNALVIGLNAGMPVTDAALRKAAGDRYEDARRDLEARGGVKHHLARDDDVLVGLADTIGVARPVSNVFSPGDLLAYAGIGWALAVATKGPPGRHRARGTWGTGRRKRVAGSGRIAASPMSASAERPGDGGGRPSAPPRRPTSVSEAERPGPTVTGAPSPPP